MKRAHAPWWTAACGAWEPSTLSALGLVEDLVGQHGQGGINELLRAMAETGSSDEAFRRVYGKSLEELQRDWATRLRQRYGR